LWCQYALCHTTVPPYWHTVNMHCVTQLYPPTDTLSLCIVSHNCTPLLTHCQYALCHTTVPHYCHTVLNSWLLYALARQWVGRVNSVGIATRYGLDGLGIESRWWRDFPQPSRPALIAHPASYTIRTGTFLGINPPVRVFDHPPPASVEVTEGVKLCPYSTSVPSWPVLGWALPLTLLVREFSKFNVFVVPSVRIGWNQKPNCLFVVFTFYGFRISSGQR
jgi:hypothetical protein